MILGVMRKDDPNVSQNRNWYNPKSGRLFFSMIVRGPFHRTDFNWKKKCGFTGLISEKPEAFYAKLNKRAEAATKTYSTTGDFLQYFYSMLVAKNYQKIQSKCSVHEFFFRC